MRLFWRPVDCNKFTPIILIYHSSYDVLYVVLMFAQARAASEEERKARAEVEPLEDALEAAEKVSLE